MGGRGWSCRWLCRQSLIDKSCAATRLAGRCVGLGGPLSWARDCVLVPLPGASGDEGPLELVQLVLEFG